MADEISKFTTAVIIVIFICLCFNSCEKSEVRMHERSMYKLQHDCKDSK